MSTRSRIGIYNPDNTISSIYCHFDGYEDGVGDMLFEHYKNEDKVKELISLGDLSSLHEEINPIKGTHTYHNPEDNVCVFYRRDRQDLLAYFQISKNLEDYFELSIEYGAEYLYVMKDNKWYYSDDMKLLKPFQGKQ
jgi:hypothetical protein